MYYYLINRTAASVVNMYEPQFFRSLKKHSVQLVWNRRISLENVRQNSACPKLSQKPHVNCPVARSHWKSLQASTLSTVLYACNSSYVWMLFRCQQYSVIWVVMTWIFSLNIFAIGRAVRQFRNRSLRYMVPVLLSIESLYHAWKGSVESVLSNALV